MDCCSFDRRAVQSGFRGGQESCRHEWDLYFRALCSLYPTLSTQMGYDRDNGTIEQWGQELMDGERRLLRHYIVKTTPGQKSCLETRVFHQHLKTRLGCMGVDRIRLFHKDGGWCVQLIDTLTHYQPYDSHSNMELARERLSKLPTAIRRYTDFLRLQAAEHLPSLRIVGAMRDSLRSALGRVRLELIPADLRESFQVSCLEPVESTLLTFLGGVECRETIGLSGLDASFYESAVYRHVTIDGVSVGDIHAFGVKEVSRLEAALDALPCVIDSGRDYRGEAAVDKYKEIVDAAQVHPHLSHLFGDLRPSRSCSVAEMPERHRAGGPLAYYSDSTFYVNTDLRHPEHQMEALAFHEAVPGHHTQRRIERDVCPGYAYRYHVHHTAFIEGWAMYTESLMPTALPAAQYGVLESELFRAVRLVVDTGVHKRGWTYDEALAYMKAHARITEEECSNEVLRYACDPGQALGYHVGRTVFRDIVRWHASDLVGLHKKILQRGSLPMNVMIRLFAKRPQGC